MSITLVTAARNVMADAVVDLLDVSGPGNVQIGTGSFASILATLTLPNPAFGSASGGTASLSSLIQDTSADNTGTAAVFRMRTSGGTAIISGFTKTSDDGSDITIDVTAQNAALNAIRTLIGAAGDIQFTTAGDTTFAAVLATINLGNPAFAAASSGSMAITGTPSGTAGSAGTCTLFRIRDTSDVEVLRGSVGTSATDIVFANNVFGVGSTITISTFSLSLPATSAASSAVLVFAGGLAFTAGETIEISSCSYSQPA
jgi:hypothetical protein